MKATNYSYNKKSRNVKKSMQIFAAGLERQTLDMIIKHGKVCPQNPMSLNSLSMQDSQSKRVIIFKCS